MSSRDLRSGKRAGARGPGPGAGNLKGARHARLVHGEELRGTLAAEERAHLGVVAPDRVERVLHVDVEGVLSSVIDFSKVPRRGNDHGGAAGTSTSHHYSLHQLLRLCIVRSALLRVASMHALAPTRGGGIT